MSVEKAYNEYVISLNNARTTRNELSVKERKLALMKKRNDLYEIQTVELMEQSWNYAEAIASFAKALFAALIGIFVAGRYSGIPTLLLVIWFPVRP